VTHHLATGQIENKDAHRAMNEAYGRLLYSRKQETRKSTDPDNTEDKPRKNFVPGDDPVRYYHPHMDSNFASEKKSSRKQAWMGWGPSKKALKHKVAGWEWDDHQNGFLSTAHRDFQCSCGEPVKVPDYHNCKCGKVWNTYIIGTGGGKKNAAAELFIAREIPVRDEVIVAKKKKAIDLQNPHYEDYDQWSNDAEHQRATEEAPFPSKHAPRRDTRSKGVNNGTTSPDWYKRDHGS
jgi:hypothetical protein